MSSAASSSSDSESDDSDVEFALTPAASRNGILNFNTSAGRKHYEGATKSLYTEELFDCTRERLFPFLKILGNRAQVYGWSGHLGILAIPKVPEDPLSATEDLLKFYGAIEMDRIRRYEATYIDQPVRPAQDTQMMYQCVMNSLSSEALNKVLIWEEQYVVKGRFSGNLLVKVVIRESHLDTNATTSTIRKQLASLDLYLPTVNHDITKLNQHIKLLVAGLKARGETTEDLMTNIFKGYLACSDKTFVRYIERKQEEYEDEGSDLTADSLMLLGDGKYKNLTQQGKFNAPSEEEQQLLALRAEVDKLKKKNSHNDSSKGGAKNETSMDGKTEELITLPKWLYHHEEPKKADMDKPRTWKGRKYYWCSKETGGKCRGNWRTHLPSNCQGSGYYRNKRNTQDEEKKDGEKPNDNEKKRLKLAKAYAALANKESGWDSDEI